MPRIFGKAGDKVESGVISDQFGGKTNVVADEHGQGSIATSSRPNVKLVPVSDSNDSESLDPFVVTSKSSLVRDLADIGNGSTIGIEKNNNGEAIHSNMNTGIEVKKPTDNIYY